MTMKIDDPEHARFNELNALAGVLPYHRRDELSALLSDADVATLRHLVESGMGANTLRAIASDLAYLERWALAATGAPLPWPATASLVVKFTCGMLLRRRPIPRMVCRTRSPARFGPWAR